MALTETRSVTDGGLAVSPTPAPTTLDAVLGTGDHKTVGRLFIGGGVIGLLAGLVIGIFASFNASALSGAPAERAIAQLWSFGRDLTLFGGVVPILIGLAVYLVPLQIGAPSLAFARGAAAAMWTWMLGGGLLILSYILNGGPGGGRRDSVVLWAFSLAMMVGGLLWAMVCVTTTILGARTKGMTLERVPMTTWSFFVFSLAGILSLPILVGELLVSYLRIRYEHLEIQSSESLTSVMDGANLAPAIYWIGIPILGMAADIIGVHSERPLKFHKPLMVAIGLFGVLAYGADTVGLASVRGVDFDNGFLVVGLFAVALPVLGTLALAGDSIRFGSFVPRTAMIGALVSGLLLLAATVAALLGTVEPIMAFLDDLGANVDMTNTLVLNGTRFHEGIRALVIGAAVVSIIAALHHWSAKIWGRKMAESLGSLSILAAAAGSVVWAVGEIAAGFDDEPWLPARVTDDFAEIYGVLSLVGLAVLAGGVGIMLANLAGGILGRKVTGSSPDNWTGATLEWATPNPPPVGNFPSLPVVRSATPLADGEIVYANDASSGDDAEGADAEEERQ